MTPMNPDSARALIWAALILNILAVVVLAPEAQFAFAVLAAVFALVPAVFARGQAGLGARFVLALSLALVYAGYPKFEQSPYMQRLTAGAGLSLAAGEGDTVQCKARYGECLDACGAGLRSCLNPRQEFESCMASYDSCQNQCFAESGWCLKSKADADHPEDKRIYRAVYSYDEEAYRMMLVDNAIPQGWIDVGKTGSLAEVGAWIDVVWPEYQRRPLSLRKKMEELGIQDTRVYRVLIDQGTGRYHAYPVEKGVPPGFKSAGVTGPIWEMYQWADDHRSAW